MADYVNRTTSHIKLANVVDDEGYQQLRALAKWQNFVSQSESSPDVMLEVMLDANLHTAAHQWTELYSLEEDFEQIIDQSEMGFLLRKDNPNFSGAFMVRS